MTTEKELLKQIQKLQSLKDRKIDEGVIAPKVKEDSKPQDHFSHESLFNYLYALRKLPRTALLARYLNDVETEPPNAPREWLIQRMAYKYQVEQYRAYTGTVPDSVLRRHKTLVRSKPRSLDPGEIESDEPGGEASWDPEMRVVAAVENPYDRGRRWTAFACIELAGDNGVSFRLLKQQLQRALDCSIGRAEKFARRAFITWVKKEWVKLMVKESR